MSPERHSLLTELDALLHAPDPPDLPTRGFRLTQPGDPGRRQTVLLPLLVRWAQIRCLDVDPEPEIGPAVVQPEPRRKVLEWPARLEERVA
jgi:hypothetical protein